MSSNDLRRFEAAAQVTDGSPVSPSVVFVKAPGGLRRSRRHLFCGAAAWRDVIVLFNPGLVRFSSRWKTTCPPLDEKTHFTVFRPFFFFSCYTTEAKRLWQEGRPILDPDRGGKQSEGHLFSLRTVFPIKPPHSQVQILSSRCKITFQRGTCLHRSTVDLRPALRRFLWPRPKDENLHPDSSSSSWRRCIITTSARRQASTPRGCEAANRPEKTWTRTRTRTWAWTSVFIIYIYIYLI